MSLVIAGDDGSEAAAAAVEWAVRFGAEREARVMVVRVGVTGGGSGSDVPVEGVTLLDESHPASGILTAVQDHDADLVVLGRRGSGGFPSLPIGTTAHQVAGGSHRPVVVVPQDRRPRSEPLVGRVVVGLDGLAGSDAAARWAIRTFGGARFTVAHALEVAPAFVPSGEERAGLYDQARARAVALLEEQWTAPFIEAGVEIDVVVEEGGAAEILLGAAARSRADLVVVGRRDHFPMRGTLGGTSQRVLAYAPCAAAMVPHPDSA